MIELSNSRMKIIPVSSSQAHFGWYSLFVNARFEVIFYYCCCFMFINCTINTQRLGWIINLKIPIYITSSWGLEKDSMENMVRPIGRTREWCHWNYKRGLRVEYRPQKNCPKITTQLKEHQVLAWREWLTLVSRKRILYKSNCIWYR